MATSEIKPDTKAGASFPGHALQHLAQLIEAEGLSQHRPLGALQLVPRLGRDRVPGGEHDAALAAPSLEPQLLEQVESRVRLVEVYVQEEGVVPCAGLFQLSRG